MGDATTEQPVVVEDLPKISDEIVEEKRDEVSLLNHVIRSQVQPTIRAQQKVNLYRYLNFNAF